MSELQYLPIASPSLHVDAARGLLFVTNLNKQTLYFIFYYYFCFCLACAKMGRREETGITSLYDIYVRVVYQIRGLISFESFVRIVRSKRQRTPYTKREILVYKTFENSLDCSNIERTFYYQLCNWSCVPRIVRKWFLLFVSTTDSKTSLCHVFKRFTANLLVLNVPHPGCVGKW